MAFLPVGEGAYGDGPLQQATGLGGAEGTPCPQSLVGPQQPVYGSSTELAELL